MTGDMVGWVPGGPGSGKLTHCHHLTEIDDQLIHVDMLNTFLDYVGNTYGGFIVVGIHRSSLVNIIQG